MKVTNSKLSVIALLVSSASVFQPAQAYQPYGYQAPAYQAPGYQPPQGGQYQQPYQQPLQGQYQQPYQLPQGQYQQPYQPLQGQYQPYQVPQAQYPYQQMPAQQQWYPYQQQPQQQVQQPQYTPPRVEATISDSTPYEQQSLVYTLRVISSGNLKTVSPELPQVGSVVLRQLGDPVTRSSNSRGGEQEIITEYRYLLMPFSSGVIEIPAARVTGTYAASGGGQGPFFDVQGRQAVILKVRPAVDSVQPWLPLYNLHIDAKIRGSDTPAAGSPVTVEVETKAVGATGSQIPSIASQFSSDEFRIYAGKNFAEGSISADGRTLLGRRVETFTLVPQYGGWLKIPAVNINWWNVRYNRPEVASLLMHQLNVAGPANPKRRGGRDAGESGSSVISVLYWVPLVIAIAILMYGWIGAFLGSGKLPGLSGLPKLVKPVLGQLYAPIASLAARVSPRRYFHRFRTWTGRRLPVSWKLWFCLRAIAHEDDPSEWAQALQILAAKHLGVRPQANLKHLGDSIAACHPRANAAQVGRLMAQLDEAVYGDKPIDSFESWKREFRKQIKPSLFPIRFRQCKAVAAAGQSSRLLPQLNPH